MAGDDPISGNLENDPKEPWHIAADQLSYDDKAMQYVGTGNVVISKQARTLTADFVRFNHKTMNVFAAGHVILTAGEDVLTGDRMEMNLETETGTVYDGSIFLRENHFYINGATLQKLGEKTYAADRATVTTCKGDNPDWRITGRNLKITVDGVGVADHATLWAKKVPVVYTPWIAFPVKRDRQSGFLFPQLGFGDRRGFDYHQPYFWAINESSDATVYFHHMEERGEKIGLEYRYVLEESSQGAAMLDMFEDRKIDDGTPDMSEQWGYEDDNTARTNTDRYWFRMKSDQTLPMGFSAKLDLDIVSDQDYLAEFKRGYAGFDDTDAYFHKMFGRDIDDYNDAVRLNRLNLNKSWSNYSLNIEARWYDDVINRQFNDINTIRQTPGFMEMDASKQQIFDSWFYADLDSEYVYFFREKAEREHRIDVYPRVYLPLKLGHYLSFEPSVGTRGTLWYEERDTSGNTVDTGDAGHYRGIYDLRADLSSEIYKIYRTNGDRLRAVKHAIRPQVVYNFIPEQDQTDWPRYNSVDRIAETNDITYSIVNTFTSKSTRTREEDEEEPQPEAGGDSEDYTYTEFCRFKIEQSYDIIEANEDDPSDWSNPKRKQPFSPVYAELNFTPHPYFSLRADARRSLYNSYFDSHNVALILRDHRGDKMQIEHRYTFDSNESIYADLNLKITEQLFARTDYEKNLFDEQEIRTGIGLRYLAGCWSLDCSYTKEDEDRQFSFMINLFGLGEFGRSFLLSTTTDPVEYD